MYKREFEVDREFQLVSNINKTNKWTRKDLRGDLRFDIVVGPCLLVVLGVSLRTVPTLLH